MIFLRSALAGRILLQKYGILYIIEVETTPEERYLCCRSNSCKSYSGQKGCLYRCGRSHKRCIEQFVELGAQVTLCDQKKSLDDFGDYADTLRRLKVNLSLGEHYTDGFAGQDIIMPARRAMKYYKPELAGCAESRRNGHERGGAFSLSFAPARSWP